MKLSNLVLTVVILLPTLAMAQSKSKMKDAGKTIGEGALIYGAAIPAYLVHEYVESELGDIYRNKTYPAATSSKELKSIAKSINSAPKPNDYSVIYFQDKAEIGKNVANQKMYVKTHTEAYKRMLEIQNKGGRIYIVSGNSLKRSLIQKSSKALGVTAGIVAVYGVAEAIYGVGRLVVAVFSEKDDALQKRMDLAFEKASAKKVAVADSARSAGKELKLKSVSSPTLLTPSTTHQ